MTPQTLDEGEHVGVECPGCSPDTTTVHEVLKPATDATVRCLSCSHVHKTTISDTPQTDIAVVVSVGGDSKQTSMQLPADEQVLVGDELIVELDDVPTGVRVTSIERAQDERVTHAAAADIGTLWTRSIDNVGVSTTIHPADGSREGTRSETYYLPGDTELTVGDDVPHLDDSVTIEGIVIRDDAVDYARKQYDHRGDSAYAKDIARVYCREDAGDTWRSAWG